MRVLVTGASGFVGQQLCCELATDRFTVRAFARRAPRDRLPGNAELVQGEITDERAVRAAVDGVDAIVHLAARAHVMRDPAADPLAEFRRVNVDGTRLLAAAARDASVKHIVFASSVKAVGDASSTPWTSATPPFPVDAYGTSKLEAEQILLVNSRDAKPHISVLRFPLVYGPGMRGNMLRLFQLIDRGWPIPVGRPANARSVLFVGNAVAAITHVLKRVASESMQPAASRPLFVTDGPGQSTAMLVQAISDALGVPNRTIPLPSGALSRVARITDRLTRARLGATLDRLLGSLEVDEREFQQEYDFQPPFTLQQGMEITAGWFRQY
jgi:nucleoside-diphosphate-sugar epimerase